MVLKGWKPKETPFWGSPSKRHLKGARGGRRARRLPQVPSKVRLAVDAAKGGRHGAPSIGLWKTQELGSSYGTLSWLAREMQGP